MTVLTLALLAGSQPAAPRLAPVHQIGPQSRRQSPHTPCAPLVRTDALTLTWQKADRHKRSAPTSSSHTPWPNPHSACGTAAAPLPAISCLGAFRPPAARARGEVRHCRQPKTCTRGVGLASCGLHGVRPSVVVTSGDDGVAAAAYDHDSRAGEAERPAGVDRPGRNGECDRIRDVAPLH